MAGGARRAPAHRWPQAPRRRGWRRCPTSFRPTAARQDLAPRTGVPVAGLVDEPDLQRVSPLTWRAADGSWLLSGPSGSGRTTALRAVVLAAAAALEPAALHVHVIDARGRACRPGRPSARRHPRSPRRPTRLRRARPAPARRGRPSPRRASPRAATRRRGSGVDAAGRRLRRTGHPRRRRRLGPPRRGPARPRARRAARLSCCGCCATGGRWAWSASSPAAGACSTHGGARSRPAPSSSARSTHWMPRWPACGPRTCLVTRRPGERCGCTTGARCSSSRRRPPTRRCSRPAPDARPAVGGAWRLRPLPSAIRRHDVVHPVSQRVDAGAGDISRPGGILVGVGGPTGAPWHWRPADDGRRLLVAGPPGSGRTNVLRVLAESLCAAGRFVAVVQPGSSPSGTRPWPEGVRHDRRGAPRPAHQGAPRPPRPRAAGRRCRPAG